MAKYLDSISGNTRIWNIPWNVVDFETTMYVSKPEPIEVAIVPVIELEIDNAKIFSALLKPTQPLNELEGKTGIIQISELANSPRIEDVKREVRRCLVSAVFVHHSNGFDKRFAANFFGANFDRIYDLSTLRMSRLINPGGDGHKLADVARRWKVNLSEAHRATNDALATAKVFIKMIKYLRSQLGIETFAALLKYYESGNAT